MKKVDNRLINKAKKEAKRLKKLYDNGDAEARTRVHKFWHNEERVTLQNCQYIIAKEQGFNNWLQLLEAFDLVKENQNEKISR